MTAATERAQLVSALERLMDRLCAPDLTISESKSLRRQLTMLLGAGSHPQRATLAAELESAPVGSAFQSPLRLA